MGKLYDYIFRKPRQVVAKHFETFTEYSPHFAPYSGGIYKQELTRAAIDRFATACSKLTPEIKGNSYQGIRRAIETYPNESQTWSQFLYRLATIYECDATAYVTKVFAPDNRTVIGLWCVKCNSSDIVELQGEPWVQFHFNNGKEGYSRLEDTLILSKFQYESDFYGTENCLDPTMQLIHAQKQAQKNAIKNGAQVRFIAGLNSQMRPEDMKKKRQQFIEDNFGTDNEKGLLLYDQTFSGVTQIDPKSYTIESGEMERIQNSVCSYFGINMKILMNDYDEDTWDAWYEGRVEPFAVQLSDGLNKLLFTQRERKTNEISFSSCRLQYASNPSKRNMIRDMLDRGVFTINQALEILQLPDIGKEGDIRVIRGEYVNASNVEKVVPSGKDTDKEKQDNDEEKVDTDKSGEDDNDSKNK